MRGRWRVIKLRIFCLTLVGNRTIGCKRVFFIFEMGKIELWKLKGSLKKEKIMLTAFL